MLRWDKYVYNAIYRDFTVVCEPEFFKGDSPGIIRSRDSTQTSAFSIERFLFTSMSLTVLQSNWNLEMLVL